METSISGRNFYNALLINDDVQISLAAKVFMLMYI